MYARLSCITLVGRNFYRSSHRPNPNLKPQQSVTPVTWSAGLFQGLGLEPEVSKNQLRTTLKPKATSSWGKKIVSLLWSHHRQSLPRCSIRARRRCLSREHSLWNCSKDSFKSVLRHLWSPFMFRLWFYQLCEHLHSFLSLVKNQIKLGSLGVRKSGKSFCLEPTRAEKANTARKNQFLEVFAKLN